MNAREPEQLSPESPHDPEATLESALAVAGEVNELDPDGSAQTFETGEDADAPEKLWSKRYMIRMFIAQFAIYTATIAPASFSLAVKVEAINPDAKNSLLAAVLTTAAVAIVIVNPVTGILSDTTRSRYGRRRPWMIGGLIGGLIGYSLIGFSNSFWPVLLGWTIGYLGLVTTASMIITHMGDALPLVQRGKVAGINGAVTQVASIGGVVLAGSLVNLPAAMFIVPGTVAFIGALIFIVRMDDPSTAHLPAQRVHILSVFRNVLFDPRQHPDFAWAWISKLMVFVGIYTMSVYTVYFLTDRLDIDAGTVASLSATAGGIGVFVTIFGAIGSGVISDRIGRRKPILMVSGFIAALGLVMIGLTTSSAMYIAGVVVFAFATGVFGAVDQALALDVIPERSASGRWVAIMALANEIPKAIAPALAAFVVLLAGGSNYQPVYFVGAFVAILGGLLVLPIRSVR